MNNRISFAINIIEVDNTVNAKVMHGRSSTLDMLFIHEYALILLIFLMSRMLCILFTHINIIPTRQKNHLIRTEYYSE